MWVSTATTLPTPACAALLPASPAQPSPAQPSPAQPSPARPSLAHPPAGAPGLGAAATVCLCPLASSMMRLMSSGDCRENSARGRGADRAVKGGGVAHCNPHRNRDPKGVRGWGYFIPTKQDTEPEQGVSSAQPSPCASGPSLAQCLQLANPPATSAPASQPPAPRPPPPTYLVSGGEAGAQVGVVHGGGLWEGPGRAERKRESMSWCG